MQPNIWFSQIKDLFLQKNYNMAEKKSKLDKVAHRDAKETILWMSNLSARFNQLITDIATGLPPDEREEDLKIIYKLKQNHEKLIESSDNLESEE